MLDRRRGQQQHHSISSNKQHQAVHTQTTNTKSYLCRPKHVESTCVPAVGVGVLLLLQLLLLLLLLLLYFVPRGWC